MMMKDLPITQYLQDLGSNKATPGGGTAAPLMAAIGASSGLMAAYMTTGKKKYESVQDEIEQIITKAEDLKSDFLQLIEQDAIDFGPLSEAFKMPSSTQSEKEQKDKKLEEALRGACNGPLTTMEKTNEALDLYNQLSKIGNKGLMSDIGIAVTSSKSALEACKLSILSNTTMMKNEETKASVEKQTDDMYKSGMEKAEQTLDYIHSIM